MTGIMCAAVAMGGFPGNVSAVNANPSDNEIGTGQPGVATFDTLTNGTWASTGESGGTYCTPSSAVSSLECRLTVNSGNNPTGSALSTWLPMNVARSWTLTVPTNSGTLTSNCTFEIRDAASGFVRSTGSVNFIVTSEP